MKKEISTYEITANDFLAKTQTEIRIEFFKHGKHFINDKDERDIYSVSLIRGKRKYIFNYGQSTYSSTHYQDKNIKERTYTLSGGNRTGGYKVNNPQFLIDYCIKIKGVQPTAYDILACLTKHDPGTFEEFCSEFGYDEDSRKAEKTYKAVKDEYMNVCSLFSDEELNELQEIQ